MGMPTQTQLNTVEMVEIEPESDVPVPERTAPCTMPTYSIGGITTSDAKNIISFDFRSTASLRATKIFWSTWGCIPKVPPINIPKLSIWNTE